MDKKILKRMRQIEKDAKKAEAKWIKKANEWIEALLKIKIQKDRKHRQRTFSI